ncbi:hypothetical protein HDU93_008238 [Gonapodya sp. JEL0774]|nr:hypothetical protein HDU93_008238 [Gonapodya sp. JEL0774]
MTGYLTSLGIPTHPKVLDYVGAALFLGIPAVAIWEGISGDIARYQEQRDTEARKKKFPADTGVYTPRPSFSGKSGLIAPTRFLDGTTKKVILHQLPREDTAPSTSLFCLKAETLLLLTSTTYENDFTSPSLFPSRKLPAYSYNGKLYEDSQKGFAGLIKDGVVTPLDGEATEEIRRKDAEWRKVIEEQAWRILQHEQWVLSQEKSIEAIQARFPSWMQGVVGSVLRKGAAKELDVTGISNTPTDRFEQLLPRVLDSLSSQLSHHMWLLGTEDPTSADASLFALLSNAVYFKETAPGFAKAVEPSRSTLGTFGGGNVGEVGGLRVARSVIWPEVYHVRGSSWVAEGISIIVQCMAESREKLYRSVLWLAIRQAQRAPDAYPILRGVLGSALLVPLILVYRTNLLSGTMAVAVASAVPTMAGNLGGLSVLTFRVAIFRGEALISLGDGTREQVLEIIANSDGKNGKLMDDLAVRNGYGTKGWELMRRVRTHGNFTENVPTMLILCGLAELSGAPPVFLKIICEQA